ncbi:cyclodeaminase/cyclohydrolase family protein [Aerococcus christensenii]|uniref:Formiminotransferase-cyclodeaminase n=1 Tax=Aerococcus christensenii TaxID=87541 RepID=A0A133Y3D4_9LACT|nr:cyclodeaminase/cyclohydrolase family protein [Aerococcus christensenii]KXB37710.1 Formiminotransferase-cyclodeaminase [Aerococcus christensenii]MDK8233351.1 cyclodeaminase/cyclohydrolase family protein [Aerococcus christensenii]
MEIKSFIQAVGSSAPSPGGGAVSAVVGAMGAALGQMASAVTRDRLKEEAPERLQEAERAMDRYGQQLLQLGEEDERVSGRLFSAYKVKARTEEEKKERHAHIQAALKEATEVPIRIMQIAQEALEKMVVISQLAKPSILSDVQVGSLHLMGALKGAYENINVNSPLLKDSKQAAQYEKRAQDLKEKAIDCLDRIESNIQKRA